MGTTIRATEKKAGKDYKVLFVTLTDGQENASSDWNYDSLRKLMKEKEDNDHWTFADIGVGANGWAQMTSLRVGTKSVGNVLRSSHGTTAQAYNKLAGMNVAYACSVRTAGACDQSVWGSDNDTTKDEEDKS